ncbi:MAG: hypothetical protein E7369_05125 [Clostridiales bacterium]|nr:hypothetical protein [Clostridiales bacterium]
MEKKQITKFLGTDFIILTDNKGQCAKCLEKLKGLGCKWFTGKAISERYFNPQNLNLWFAVHVDKDLSVGFLSGMCLHHSKDLKINYKELIF